MPIPESRIAKARRALHAVTSPVLASPLIRRVIEATKNTRGVPARACHVYRLAIDTNGDVYPCCNVYRSPYHRIGNLADPDLAAKIEDFDRLCCCGPVKLRPKSEVDPTGDERVLNLELSLACQAVCAMCCVDAPGSAGKYERYDALTNLIREWAPGRIVVQGGEVLIQKRSMEWVRQVRRDFPGLKIELVTNGNVPASMAEEVAQVFDGIVISFVGIQLETYRAIMGLELKKTIAFAAALVERGRPPALKFLITPINVHEVGLFIRTAAALKPRRIVIAESGIAQYVVANTFDDFWAKIVDRASKSTREALVAEREALESSGATVRFDGTAGLLGIEPGFLESAQLGRVVEPSGA
jgi:MoaA/NifB/PqqE/SkfB family radical SAM enzyme